MEELQDRIGYHFNSTQVLEEALYPAGTRPLQGNKRLALVGDSVLSISILDGWYDSKNTIGNGESLLQKHACNENLSSKGKDCGLDEYVMGRPAQKGKISKGTRATTVEAILGAVWIDSGKNINEVDRVKASLGLGV